jgi:hypothetical protein
MGADMKFADVTSWVEQHPTESIVIGAGGVLVVLWLLGAFSSSGSASDSGSSNLASAYYAAEAQQAVVGGQIQMATIQAAASTAMNASQVNGAVAINKAQTSAAVKINNQNANAGMIINQSNNDAANYQMGLTTNANIVGSNNQLLATYSNNSTALETVRSNNAAAITIDQSNNNAGLLNNYLGTIMAPELARSGGFGNFSLPGLGSWTVNTGAPTNVNDLIAHGWTPNMAYQLASIQQGGIRAP